MSVRAFAPASAEPLAPGQELELDDEESHYLVKVRRVRVGQTLELLDPHGSLAAATLIGLGRRTRVRVDALRIRPEPPERILLLGLPDPAAALEALTGACEAGASEVVLVACERSQGRVPAAVRVERIVRAAQRQCGRARAPLVLGLDEAWSLTRALDHRRELPGWFAWEALSGEPGPTLAPAGGLRLLVGPEGGFTSTELEPIRAAGMQAVSLGPWILRTPTATVALLARAWTGTGR
ncbi:RsmE family RNA methyltransferase [Nannocystaceae bacterium ST9]